jgi:sulfatase modifying factor 1
MPQHRAANPRRAWAAVIALLMIAAGAWLAHRHSSSPTAPPRHEVFIGDGSNGPTEMAWVPGGEFLMGSDHRLAQPNEKPAHGVRVRGFWMDRTHVTNAQFQAFVQATGYVTTAERKPDWESLRVQLPPGTPQPPDAALQAGAMVFVGDTQPARPGDELRWWRFVAGAQWRLPQGPGSSIEGKDDHPVVQVSHEDALAYAHWQGKRLPTEAEWEFAARGGLEQATYVWGNEPEPQGKAMAATWSNNARFPVAEPRWSAKAGGAVGTLPSGSFPPNGYGLADMTGNAWQWVADWYRADAFQRAQRGIAVSPSGPALSFDPDDPLAPSDAPKRVIRGGSFLCSEAYCLSYRPSARRGADPFTSMSHIGFRLVADAPAPQRRK